MSHYAAQPAKVPPHPILSAESCDGCGVQGAVLTQLGMCYCPTCTQKHALAHFATEQLRTLLGRVAQDWVRVWGNQPHVLLSAMYEMEELGQEAMEEALEAHRAPADAVPCAAD